MEGSFPIKKKPLKVSLKRFFVIRCGSASLIVKDKLQFFFCFAINRFDDAFAIFFEAGSSRDRMTHDDVRFEIEQVIGLSFASSIGQDAGRLLERRRRDERIGAQGRFGDPEEHRRCLRRLSAFFDRLAILLWKCFLSTSSP